MIDREASLREAERLHGARGASDPYGAAIRATRMPIVIVDARLDDHPIVFANDAFLSLTGYPRDEVIGRNCRFLQGPDTDRSEVARVAAAVAAREHVEAEILNYRKDGQRFWNGLFVSPVFDGAGEITHFFASQVDMTARKTAEADLARAKADAEARIEERASALERALEQKTVLLHEVDHRVKNNLQLISSLILLQSRRLPDPEARRVMTGTLNRVSALATVHRNLFSSEDVASFDVPGFMRAIASDLVDASGRDDIRIDFDLKPAIIPAARAAAVALMVNELATNVMKHAFPDRPGRLRLGVRENGEDIVIEVEDDGVGRTEPAEPPGFGLTLIELLAKQLSASIDRDDVPPGTRVTVRLPKAFPGSGVAS